MEKLKRFTIDLTEEEHLCVKVASAKLGVTMREFTQSALHMALSEVNESFEKQDRGAQRKEELNGEFVVGS